MSGLFLLGSLFGTIAVLLPMVLVLGLIIVVALRGEPDEAGGRAAALYLSLATFVGLFTLLVATTTLSASIVDLVSDDDSGFDSSFGSDSFSGDVDIDPDVFAEEGFSGDVEEEVFTAPDPSFGSSGGFTQFNDQGQDDEDRAITSIIQSLIAIAAALVVLRFHWPRLENVRSSAAAGTAAARMHQAHCYVVCFTVVVTMLVSASVATFAVVQALAPGTTGAANRGDPMEAFVPLAVLTAGAALLFRTHWSRLDLPPFLQRLPAAPPAPPTGDTPAV